MSRFEEYEGDGDDEWNGNSWAAWEQRARLAINGKRGRKALAELREALMALPEKRLIADAMCTVNVERRVEEIALPEPAVVEPNSPFASWARDRAEEQREKLRGLVATQGEGVCAVAAYLWHQKVKGGMDPVEAFDSLPTLAETGEGGTETARLGRDAGLTWTLAYELASNNDDAWDSETYTPEQRYTMFMDWIDKVLASPPLRRPEPKAERRRRRLEARAAATVTAPTGPQTMAMGLVP